MIISASRRTDIPAFYMDWFMNRLQAGYCLVANPYNPKQVSRVSLQRDEVDAIVFWTKDPSRALDRFAQVTSLGYPSYVLFTLNDYPAAIEPGVPTLADRLQAFRDLARAIGPDRVVWRYDPIIFSDSLTPEHHARTFAALAHALHGSTHRAVVSFVDFYKKTECRMAGVERGSGDRFAREPLSHPGLSRLAADLLAAGATADISLQSCAEDPRIAGLGIPPGKCIDDALIARVLGVTVDSGKDPGQRPDCRCVRSRDIGAANTCLHGCAYCYATTSHAAAAARARIHDPECEFLVLPPHLCGE